MTRVLSEPPKKRSVMLRKLEAHLGLSFSMGEAVGPGGALGAALCQSAGGVM